MKKHNSKKPISIIMTVLSFLLVIMPVSAYSSYEEKNVLDLSELLYQSDNNQDIEIHKYTAEEYKQVILNDENIPSEVKNNMISEVNQTMKTRVAYDYWTIYANCKVDTGYTCRPYFYTYSSFFTGGSPKAIIKVQHANIDRNDNGTTKQFSGKLYYNLEASNKLYWDLNGDFYNNGTTALSGGISIGVGENTSVNFSVSYSSNYYNYCHKSSRITF